MKETKALLEEYQSLLGNKDQASLDRKEEIVRLLESRKTPETESAVESMINRNLQRIDGEMLSIKAQLGEFYEVLPLSYIAKTFFGKSPSWLYQRINGIPVRGRVYSLNEEQKKIFNAAMQELSKFYGSFRLA